LGSFILKNGATVASVFDRVPVFYHKPLWKIKLGVIGREIKNVCLIQTNLFNNFFKLVVQEGEELLVMMMMMMSGLAQGKLLMPKNFQHIIGSLFYSKFKSTIYYFLNFKSFKLIFEVATGNKDRKNEL
ncbi:hypothetical protein ACJX0J_024123, partial [Zea mays]